MSLSIQPKAHRRGTSLYLARRACAAPYSSNRIVSASARRKPVNAVLPTAGTGSGDFCAAPGIESSALGICSGCCAVASCQPTKSPIAIMGHSRKRRLLINRTTCITQPPTSDIYPRFVTKSSCGRNTWRTTLGAEEARRLIRLYNSKNMSHETAGDPHITPPASPFTSPRPHITTPRARARSKRAIIGAGCSGDQLRPRLDGGRHSVGSDWQRTE